MRWRYGLEVRPGRGRAGAFWKRLGADARGRNGTRYGHRADIPRMSRAASRPLSGLREWPAPAVITLTCFECHGHATQVPLPPAFHELTDRPLPGFSLRQFVEPAFPLRHGNCIGAAMIGAAGRDGLHHLIACPETLLIDHSQPGNAHRDRFIRVAVIVANGRAEDTAIGLSVGHQASEQAGVEVTGFK